MKFFCSFDFPDEVSYTTTFKMFKKNLESVGMLPYIYVFNLDNVEDQLKFVCGTADWEQWAVRHIT